MDWAVVLTLRDPQRDALTKASVGKYLAKDLGKVSKRAFFVPERSQVCVIGARDQTTHLTLDGKGRVIQTISPLRRTTMLQFDGDLLAAAVGPTGLVVRYGYDAQNRLARLERADGATEHFRFDEAGRLGQLTFADGSSLHVDHGDHGATRFIDRNGGEVVRDYDAAGALNQITDALGRKTRLTYSDWNRPDRVTYADGAVETYSYEDRACRQTINGRPHAEYRADDAGRLIQALYEDGQSTAFAYNDAGKVTLATSDDATVTCEYDDQGRILSEDQDGHVVRYSYDAEGQLGAITLPDGQSVAFDYDLDGRLNVVTDWQGRRQRFNYDAHARPTFRELPNGLIERYAVDAMGRQRGVALAGPAGVVWAQTYERDLMDRVSLQHDSRHGGQQYQYDNGGRLVAVHDARTGTPVEFYAYDAADNRVHSHFGKVLHDERDQPTADDFFTFRHDALGNRVERSSEYGSTRYHYSRQNLLTKITHPDGTAVRFAYDAFGRRVRKTSADLSVTYIWAGQHMVQEIAVRAGAVITREYLYAPGTHRPLALQHLGRISFYHCDHLGTPQLLTDASGKIVWSARYDAYGTVVLAAQDVSQPLRFAGQHYDEETGLLYNRARYYDARHGRYLSRDPIAPVAGINPYLYVGGNPINETDPLGLWGESWPGWVKTTVSIAGAVVAGVAVGAAVVAAAPFIGIGTVAAGVIALAAGGLAAGAVGSGLNAAMTVGGCVPCAMLRGAALGLFGAGFFIAALPFELGLAGIAAVGAVAGGATYVLDWATSDKPWSTGDFATSVALGAILAPIAEWIGGRVGGGDGDGDPAVPEDGPGRSVPEDDGAPRGDEDPQGDEDERQSEELPGKPIESGLGDAVDAQVNRSPTLRQNWEKLSDDGWTMENGNPGDGSRCDPDNKIITLDPALKDNPNAGAATVAHEIGHADGPGVDYDPSNFSNRDDYVDNVTDQSLTDEGRATLKNGQARQEIIDNGGDDIGYPGNPDNTPAYDDVVQRVNKGQITPEQGASEIGKIYDQGETVSGTDQKYGDYMRNGWGDYYDGVKGTPPAEPAPSAP